MTERFFIDTNILYYAHDLSAGSKHSIAQRLLKEAIETDRGVLSTQVLQEFFVISTSKLKLEAAIARRHIELLLSLDVVDIRSEMILRAIDLHRLHDFSFWDALVIEAALAAGCRKLYSEDLQHGRTIEGIRIENPFRS